jgi:Arc/MetJ-type ribon-helix-helix transcriptional regulator
MKERVSATIDRETKEVIERILKRGNYRNISHLIESAIKLLAEESKK